MRARVPDQGVVVDDEEPISVRNSGTKEPLQNGKGLSTMSWIQQEGREVWSTMCQSNDFCACVCVCVRVRVWKQLTTKAQGARIWGGIVWLPRVLHIESGFVIGHQRTGTVCDAFTHRGAPPAVTESSAMLRTCPGRCQTLRGLKSLRQEGNNRPGAEFEFDELFYF